MNTQSLIENAALAIVDFRDECEGSCCLYIRDGEVLANPTSDFGPNHPKALMIERYEMSRCFSKARQHAIGRELFILYTKDKECQAHPKP